MLRFAPHRPAYANPKGSSGEGSQVQAKSHGEKKPNLKSCMWFAANVGLVESQHLAFDRPALETIMCPSTHAHTSTLYIAMY